MVCRGEKTMKVKRINLYSYAKEVLVSGREIFLVATSNLGRSENVPAWPEYILHERWHDPAMFVQHSHPMSWTLEYVLSGSLQVSVDGARPVTAHSGEFLFLPMGVPNELRTGDAGYCNKMSLGFTGTVFSFLAPNSPLLPTHAIPLPDGEAVKSLLLRIAELLPQRKESAIPELAGLALTLFLLLERAAKSKIPPELGAALYILESQLSHPYRISDLQKELKISRAHLTALFLEHFHLTPKQYFRKRKLLHAAGLLENTGKSIKDIALDVGYSNQLVFSSEFRKQFGVSPMTYRKNEKSAAGLPEKL